MGKSCVKDDFPSEYNTPELQNEGTPKFRVDRCLRKEYRSESGLVPINHPPPGPAVLRIIKNLLYGK